MNRLFVVLVKAMGGEQRFQSRHVGPVIKITLSLFYSENLTKSKHRLRKTAENSKSISWPPGVVLGMQQHVKIE